MKKILRLNILVMLLATLFLFGCGDDTPTANYVVKFDVVGGSTVLDYKGKTIEVEPVTTKADFVFDGWYLDDAYTSEKVTFPYTVTKDITLYAKWNAIPVKTFDVTFNVDGGSTVPAVNVSVIEAEPVTTKDNHTFLGWYTTNNYSGQRVTFPYTVTSNTTLYAKWEKVTDPLLEKFATILTNEYTSYTFDYTFSIPLESYVITETDYIQDNNYRVNYTESEINLEYFISYDSDNSQVLIYENNNDEFNVSVVTLASWEDPELYGDYYPYAVNPWELTLSVDNFEVKDGKLYCIADKLNVVAEEIFGLGDNDNFTEIVITISDTTITSISGKYDSTDEAGDYSAEIVYEYSDYNSTIVTLPEVEVPVLEVPSHVDTTNAVDLTGEQQTLLGAALGKTYESYAMDYTSTEVLIEGEYTTSEIDLVDGSVVDITYTHYYFGSSYYMLTLNQDYSGSLYQINYNTGLWEKEDVDSETMLNYYYPYAISPSELELNANLFSYIDNTYVVKGQTNLAAVATALNIESELVAFELTLTGNNITKLYYIEFVEDATYGDYYITSTYVWSDIDEITLQTPTEGGVALLNSYDALTLTQLTDTQKTSLQTALNKSLTNVTITETVFGERFYFAGDNIKVEYYDDMDNLVEEYYTIHNGIYYEVVDGVENPISYEAVVNSDGSVSGFEYYVLCFDFSKINVENMQYNEANDSYVINARELAIEDFAYYWVYDGLLHNYFEFILDENQNIVEIKLNSLYYGEEITNASATFTDYGTTSVN